MKRAAKLEHQLIMALWFLMGKQIYHIKGIKCFSLVIIPLQAFVSQIVWQTHNYFLLQLLEMISALKRNMPTAEMGFICDILLYFSILPLPDF